MKRSLPRRAFNRILNLMARFLPGSTSLRPFLHRLREVKIEGRVFIGDDVYLENEYPDCVEIHDGAGIGLRSTIVAHSGGTGERGKIVIGKNAAIMSCCSVICSAGRTLTIGDGSVISAGSVVTNDIPPHTLCSGPKAHAVATVTVPYTLEASYGDFVRGLRPLRVTNQANEEPEKVA